MNKNELKEYLSTAAMDGTLLTPKHAPDNLSTTYSHYRTVLTHDLADNLDSFIASDDYVAREYRNNSYPDSPIYIVIEPSPTSGFSVTASGVAGNAPLPSYPVNCLVIVSGLNNGWHIFGEDSSVISRKERAGEIVYLADLA